jgi:hypothetical protein
MIRVWVCVVVFTAVASARADELPDAGVDLGSAGSADGSGSAGAVEPVLVPVEPDKKPEKKPKKAKKHDDALPTDQGDISSGDAASLPAGGVLFRFLIQTRYRQTIADHSDPITILDPRLDDGYSINRAFLRATTKPRAWLTAKMLVDLAELSHKNPKRTLKLAYAEMQVHPRVYITAGLFKRTFSLLELLPVADFELADSGPTDDLIKDAELGGRDVGAMVRVDPLRKRKWLSAFVGVFDGGLGGVDARPAGLVTARLVAQPIKHLRLGIDGAWRPRGKHPPGGITPDTGPGRATSADVIYARKHYELRAEWLWGTRSDEINAADAKTFMAAWGIAALRKQVGAVTLMPAARFEWLDADREHPIGRRFYMSGALNVMDLADTFRVVVDVSRSIVQAGSFPLSVPPVLRDTSSTVVVVQAQVKI